MVKYPFKESLELQYKEEFVKKFDPLIDYLFWIFLILFTNPGGISEAFNIHDISGKVDLNDLIFVLLSFFYILISNNYSNSDTVFKKIKSFLYIFLIYYFVFNVFIVPQLNNNKSYSLLFNLIKSRYVVYYVFLFIYIYEFFKRRLDIFTRVFTYSTVLVLFVFLFQVLVKIKILPIFSLNRGFINIDRNLMLSEGILLLIVPLAIVIIIFKINVPDKKKIFLGFILLAIYYVISLRRKDMLTIFIYFLLATMVYNYITGHYKSIIKNFLKTVTILVILIVGSYFVFPNYTKAAGISLMEIYNIVMYGKTSTGEKDERLGLNRTFIVEQFSKHPIFGTGFDNRWRGSGENQGYESGDYPLLAAFARYGIIGVLIIIPIYIIIVKILINDIRYLQKNKTNHQNLEFLFLMTFIMYFVFHLFQYFNWFCAFSSGSYYYWFFFLSFYLAARYRFYFLHSENHLRLNLKTYTI